MPSAEAIKNKTIFEDRDDFRQFRHFLEDAQSGTPQGVGVEPPWVDKKDEPR
jgi:hypothetical protein